MSISQVNRSSVQVTVSDAVAGVVPRITVGKIVASLRLFALPISLFTVPMVTAAVLPPAHWDWPVLIASTLGVAMLHLVALNVLYPKIVGSRVHLNPLVVTFSLMIWGFLWDAPGLLLAIPLTAGLKAVCDNVKGLRAFGKFLGD